MDLQRSAVLTVINRKSCWCFSRTMATRRRGLNDTWLKLEVNHSPRPDFALS